MSHNVETMAYANQLPWHGLGTKVPEGLTGDEFLRAAGLDWEVSCQPMFANTPTGMVDVPGHFAIMRGGQALGVVGKRYMPIQNRELFGIPDDLVADGSLVGYETAGSLQAGRIVWALSRLKGFSVKRKGLDLEDRVDSFLLRNARHDGEGTVLGGITQVRVVCNNTLDWALSDGLQNRIGIRHTRSGPERLKAAHRMFANLIRVNAEQAKVAQELADAEFSTDRMRVFSGDFLDATRGALVSDLSKLEEDELERAQRRLDRREETVSEMVELFGEGTGNTGESKWDAYNALTEWIDHRRSVVKKTQDEHAAAERRMHSTLLGAGWKDKGTGMKLLRKA